VSESPLGDAAETAADEEVPDLVAEPDNDPDDAAEYVAGEVQDREGTDRPAVDKHPED
jgi:hypothetical protein